MKCAYNGQRQPAIPLQKAGPLDSVSGLTSEEGNKGHSVSSSVNRRHISSI